MEVIVGVQSRALALVAILCVAAVASAQNMTIEADLTDAPRGLIRSTMTMPVKPGPLTLVYPQWIPGDHSPTGPISEIAGLKFSANGKTIPWRRDLTDMYAVHLEIPAGVTKLDAQLEYLASTGGSGSEDPTTTSQLAVLNWNLIALFPQGSDAAKIIVDPTIKLPNGWQYGCSMEPTDAGRSTDTIAFKPVSLEMLIDQPVIAGQHLKHLALGENTSPQHVIDVVADSDAALAVGADRLKAYQRIPAEFAALFGARHYERYHFLLALSDQLGLSGLEHHQSSDNRGPERSLIDDDVFANFAALLTHEYFHSWNGKHRRPANMLSPDYQKPMGGDLLWVYEGLTEYYGDVMAARVGLWTPEDYRENLAAISATLRAKQGRTWRPLQDTADMASKLYGTGRNWQMRRRGVDFYDEGELLWLDADTLIRLKTDGKKSLDDFCRAFHGAGSGKESLNGSKPTVAPYTADDVYAELNKVYPHDWKAFFTKRLTSLDPEPPLGGITQGGWKLVYTSKPNKLIDAYCKSNKKIDLRFSLGLMIDSEEHEIVDVVPDSPADKVGLGPGMKIIAVNGRKFDDDLLKDAVAATPKTKGIELLVENATYYSTKRLEYDGGPRSPHLERIESSRDILDKIIAPRVK
jgi:predicted metalloprotease with PDZ domain